MLPTPPVTRPAHLGAALVTILVLSLAVRSSGAALAVAPAGTIPTASARSTAPGQPISDATRADIERQIERTATPAGLKTSAPLGSFESNVTGEELGFSVSTAGDVNGDGFSDIVALGYVGTSNTALFLFFGSASGFSLAPGFPVTTLPYGATVVNAAGDVNGDGHADIVMGWPAGTAGTIRVFLGTSTGFDIAHPFVDFQNYANFYGQVVGTAGDVNGDGYDDVIIGSPQSGDQISLCPAANQNSLAGRVDVFYGSATGLSSTRRWTIWGCNNFGSGAYMGAAASTAGDVNGDGYDDIVIGIPGVGSGSGEIAVLYGSASGLPLLSGYADVGALTGATEIGSPTAAAGFGTSAITAGDVNGDGYADVAVGSPNDTTYANGGGSVSVFLGGAGGLGTTPLWTEWSSISSTHLGRQIVPAGDVNGDGLGDLLVGETSKIDIALSFKTTMLFTGAINVSNSSGLRGFCTAGDVNGDGLSDVVVGDGSFANGQTNEGHIVVFPGIGDGPETSPYYTAFGVGMGVNFGWCVSSAGDVNGDGYDDFLIGSPTFNNVDLGQTNNGMVMLVLGGPTPRTNGYDWNAIGNPGDQIGVSVCRAGDINGDGYGDIIVGGHQPGTGNGEACIWYGKPGGLVPGSPPDVVLTGFVANSQFGAAVASGDFNGDGYADVAVGAPQEDNGALTGAGAAYVYLGGPGGLATTPAWSVHGVQTNQYLGSALAGDGDVNGDGYTDLLVGSPGFDGKGPVVDAGLVGVYHGRHDPVPLALARSIVGTQAGEQFGDAVAHVGDVNGDGYGDVAVGAPFFTSTLSGQGRAAVFAGSSTGVSSTPIWNQFGSEAGGAFGNAVADAGDVNGDGLSDVLVCAVFEENGGAHDRGVARIFAGPLPSGAPALWTVNGSSTLANLGSVANAGDVDGDGFSDIVVGMPDFGNRQGEVWLFSGAQGFGHHNGHATALDGSRIIQPLGASTSTGFGLSYDAVSAAGRTWSKMQWSAKPAVAFSNPDRSGVQSGFTHALAPDPARASEAALMSSVSGLAAGLPYSWRARSLSRSVYFPTTIWQSPVHSGALEYDLRAPGTWVGVGDAPPAATDLALSASPNPMRSRSTISFRLAQPAHVSLAILDVQGRRVRSLVDGMQAAGAHDVSWGGEMDDGHPAADGVYFYRLETGGKATSRKLALVR